MDVCTNTPTHTPDDMPLSVQVHAQRRIQNTHTHTHNLFTSHAHTVKSVRGSPIRDENKPVSGRFPPRKSTVAIVEPWNHGNCLIEASGAADTGVCNTHTHGAG